MSKRITVSRDIETTTKEVVTIEVPDDFPFLGNPYLDEEFDPFNYKVIEEREQIEETHEWGSWEIA